MKIVVCVVCVGLSALVAIAGTGAPTIEGNWTIIAASDDGKQISADEVKKFTMVVTFKAGKYSVTKKGKKHEGGSYKLDPKANPPTIDLAITEGDFKGKNQAGIYKLEGDRVTFAIAKADVKDRPKNFQGGKGIEVTVLKRNK